MRTLRRRAASVSVTAAALLAALAAFVNLAWFDQPLDPELTVLRSAPDISLENNAYVLAMGFLANAGKDPQVAGQEIVQTLNQRFGRGERITLTSEELEAILGNAGTEETWRGKVTSLECNARVYLDCAEQIIEEVVPHVQQDPRLASLLDRYESLLDQPRFEEIQRRDILTPHPPYRLIRDVGRLRLAISYHNEPVDSFLRNTADGVAFWRDALGNGATLVTKMVAIAGIQDHLDFLSALMRARTLDESQLAVLQDFVRPLTDTERDIGGAFVSEARIALLSDPNPMIFDASWLSRLLIQENATLNEEYRTVFEPMVYRASLTAQQFYRQEAYRPLPYAISAFPPPIYNLGGKLARRSAWVDPEQYVARVHDESGRISLVLLQSELESDPEKPVNEILRTSIHRNPYTDEPMTYDAMRHTIGFECLHTAYHPPALPDDCSISVIR